MDNPSRIMEGGVEFSKILVYLNVKEKLLFGEKFRIYEEDREILRKLCSYFIKDKENCRKFDIDIKRGILLDVEKLA